MQTLPAARVLAPLFILLHNAVGCDPTSLVPRDGFGQIPGRTGDPTQTDTAEGATGICVPPKPGGTLGIRFGMNSEKPTPPPPCPSPAPP